MNRAAAFLAFANVFSSNISCSSFIFSKSSLEIKTSPRTVIFTFSFNVFGVEDLRLFDTRVKKETEKEEITYAVEAKIDGLSVSLEYVDRKFCKRCNSWKWTNPEKT